MSFLGTLGAGSLGSARGAIIINTSQAQQAAAQMRSVGQQIAQSMQPAQAGVQSFGNALNQLRGQIAAIGIAAVAFSRQGLFDADTIRSYRIQFTALLGDQQTAISQMESLTEQANLFGGSLESFFALGRTLLPVLAAVGGELDDWVERAARLASTDPLQGIQGAIIAIREFTAGQARSLRERFEIPITLVRQAREQFTDVGQQMDFILEKMGATRAASVEIAEGLRGSWQQVRNELMLTLAVGFTPIMEQGIIPLLQATRDFLRELRETNPELVQMAANFTVAVAAVAPLLLLFSQLARVIAIFKDARVAGALASLTRLGTGAAGIGLIGVGAAGLNRQVQQDTGVNLFQRALDFLSRVLTNAGNIAEYIFAARLRAAADAVSEFQEGMGQLVMGLGLVAGAAGMESTATNLLQAGRDIVDAAHELRVAAYMLTVPRTQQLPAFEMAGGRRPRAQPAAPEFTEEQLEAIYDWRERVGEIERSANQERIAETQSYAAQRNSVIRDYELQLVREAQDYALQRLRAVQQLARSIANVLRDAARREAEWRKDLEERIADIRQDSQKRLEDMERDHRDRVEQLTRDHRVRLLELAARLDARGIVEENRRFNNQLTDLQKDYDKRTQQERENLEERIQQEREATEERIIEAREADQRRIEDMRQAFEEEQRVADEDRAIRLQRLAEDHQNQLDEMALAHRDRMVQITAQALAERQELDREFIKRLAKLGLFHTSWMTLQEQWQQRSLESFRKFWEKVKEEADKALQPRLPHVPGPIQPFQAGGAVGHTGLALLHRGEQVLNEGTSNMLRRLLGGSFNQQQLVSAMGGSNISLVLGPGSIVVNESSRPGMTGLEIEAAFLNIVRRLT